MKIPVVGFDPSLRHWGIAEAQLDLTTGILDTPKLTLIEPKHKKGRQVRQNSTDLAIAEMLAQEALRAAQGAKVIFVEVPVGSKSARAMASYGVCLGILGSIRAAGHPLIEVTPAEVKLSLTANEQATKEQMIQAAMALYPKANFPTHNNKVTSKSEHVADAIGAIHAGTRTQVFQNLMRLYTTTME